jgi:hypothetical protein
MLGRLVPVLCGGTVYRASGFFVADMYAFASGDHGWCAAPLSQILHDFLGGVGKYREERA